MLLIDTSGLLAAVDPRQAHHAAAAAVLMRPQRRILSPFVLAELDYLMSRNAPQSEELKLLGDVARGVYQLELMNAADIAAAMPISGWVCPMPRLWCSQSGMVVTTS